MSTPRRLITAVTAALVAVVVALIAAPASSATPYTNRPKLTLSSGIVVIYHYMAVTGTGYVPFENVTISIDNPAHVQLVIKADAAGHFVTNVLVPPTLPLGSHTVIGTGQYAHDGYDVAKASVVVVGSIAGIPVAYQHPLAPQLPPVGVTTPPAAGLAVVLAIGLAAVLMLAGGAYVLITARRRTTVL